jgi:BirA family biotin operon repressor/biotin-[acetyl-CoA-carboxylase] ligase
VSDQRLETLLGDRPLRYYSVTGSTNDDLRDWLEEEPQLPSGAVVVAEGQRRGRGRFRRPWSNASGGSLAITMLVRTTDPRGIPMAAGLAVREALREILSTEREEGRPDEQEPGAEAAATFGATSQGAGRPAVSLKWPNDVLIGDQKVCGILVESAQRARNAYLLGIGINVSGEFGGSEFAFRATSIGSHIKGEIDTVSLAVSVITGVDRWLKNPDLHPQWRQALSTLGREVTVHAPNRVVEGRAVDVDEEGLLIVRTHGGGEERFAAGDVSVRRSTR